MASPTRKRTCNKTPSKEEETSGKPSDNTRSGEPVGKQAKLDDTVIEQNEKKQSKSATMEQGNAPSGSQKQSTNQQGFVKANKLQAESGDLIELDRGLYAHWALYVGDGMVIHVTGDGQDITVKEAECRKMPLVEVAGDNLVRVNNHEKGAEKRKLKAYKSEVIVKNAEDLLGQMLPYNVISKNCEHYVAEWRYGQGWSAQVDTVDAVLSNLLKKAPKSSSSADTTDGGSEAHNGSDLMNRAEAVLNIAAENPNAVSMLMNMFAKKKD